MGRAKEISLKVIPGKVANPFVRRHHYSGTVVNNSCLHFGVFLDGQLHGVMSYGPSLNKSKILPLVAGTGWNEYLELNRMAFDSVLPRNSESRAISLSIRLLKKYAPHVKWIVSFADACSCGDGAIYRASNFVLTGIKENEAICYEVHQKARDILDGRKIDPTFYPVIYGADEADDWTSSKVWKKANPSLGITVDIEKLEAACESARQNPAEENLFRQLRLCQWVKQAVRWMPMEKWDKCAFAVDPEALQGRACYGGLDLSSTTDITAFVLVFPPEYEGDKYVILPFFWIPEDNLDLRVRRDHVPYDVWEKQGYLKTTEGNVVHYGFIESFIDELGAKYNIREIAFDRWGATQMVQNLEGLGFTVVPFGQGFKDMSPPTKELMRLTLDEQLAHGGHPVLRWMMDNIHVRTDPAGNVKPDKEKSTEKIDGAVATIMALDRAIRGGGDTGASIYDERGLLLL